MRAEFECIACRYVWSKPWPWAVCPGCGADPAQVREHPAEPAHEHADARGEEEIDSFAQWDLSIDVNNPQEG
jgi:hypothetical protein